MAVLALVVACAAIASAYQLFQLFAAWWFLRHARRYEAQVAGLEVDLPPVTILKPLKGRGVDLYANLASFCRQDYPSFQIVFGVEDPNDPAVAVVQQIRRDYPGCDLVLAVGHARGADRKVANLTQMMRHAHHDVLVMSDGDVRVGTDYLRRMVAPLAAGEDDDPPVALTTCLYRGARHFGMPSLLESLFINTDFMPMVLAAQLVQRFRYAYGASIALTREALERIGGFSAIADYLADDYLLGNRVAHAGYRLVLLPYTVETVVDSVAMADVWRHLLRWSRTYRVQQPVGWFCSVITHAIPWGLGALLVSGGSPLGWLVFSGAVAARLGSLAGILHLLGDRQTMRLLGLVPAKDLLTSAMWLAAFLGREVNWSGQWLVIARDGRMLPAAPERPVLHAEPERLRAAGS
jgi:ceramide glucosyltransferase